MSLKIALIGYGKMGKMIDALASQENQQVVARIDPTTQGNQIDTETIAEADICIDFSHPDAVLENIRKTVSLGKSIVVGTTGWYDHLPEVETLVNEKNVGLFYSPNFSIGVNLFLQIAARAAKHISSHGNYTISCQETHHENKVDAPSGTAMQLTNMIDKNIPIRSYRVGTVVGEHSIQFDSPEDTITLSHFAKNREGFAMGAIQAAEWMMGKKGIFTMENLIEAAWNKSKVCTQH